MTISTKFEVGMNLNYLVSVFAADTLHDLMTLTLNPLTLESDHIWRVMLSTLHQVWTYIL